MAMSHTKNLKPETVEEEILSRTRRIETRLTQFMIGMGVHTQGQKPSFDQASSQVRIPSMHSSLQELLDSIPQGWQGPIRVCIGDKQLAVIEVF